MMTTNISSRFEGKSFIVEKNGRPWAELRPSKNALDAKKSAKQIKLFKKIYDFSKTLPKMDETAVETLRRLRHENV